MNSNDLPDVVELTKQLGYPSTSTEIENRFERLRTEPGDLLLVARQEKVYGWIHLRTELSLGSDPRVEVVGLVVDEAVRGQGIGAKLMDEAERWARKQGLAKMRLRSNIKRGDAHRFYEKLGYGIQKTSHVMVKDLAK